MQESGKMNNYCIHVQLSKVLTVTEVDLTVLW